MSAETSNATLAMSSKGGVVKAFSRAPLFSPSDVSRYALTPGSYRRLGLDLIAFKVLKPYLRVGELPACNLRSRALEPIFTYPPELQEPDSRVDSVDLSMAHVRAGLLYLESQQQNVQDFLPGASFYARPKVNRMSLAVPGRPLHQVNLEGPQL